MIISCGYRQSVGLEEANGPPSTDYMNCCKKKWKGQPNFNKKSMVCYMWVNTVNSTGHAS